MPESGPVYNRQPPQRIDFVAGASSGLSIPLHAAALLDAGADFLTRAFQSFGVLSTENQVAEIVSAQRFSGGNSGDKLRLKLRYARTEPGLDTDLFVKFSRDFDDAFRDRRRHELEPEVRLARLSREREFPIEVPPAYFADFDPATGSGLMISAEIGFGRDGMEPLHPKCMDHRLEDPAAYYAAIFDALARLAAAQHSGALCTAIEQLFPFDAEAAASEDPIPWTADQLRAHIARIGQLLQRSPQLFPATLADPAFIERLESEALQVLALTPRIQQHLHADARYVALSHYNGNIDNAFFRRDADGSLRAGLFDWGRARQMNLACALWGSLCGAPPAVWHRDAARLFRGFIDSLAAYGGPRLDTETLNRHLDLYVTTIGLAMMMELPALIATRLPEALDASGPLDPLLLEDPVVHGFLHVFTNFLDYWQRADIAASLAAV